MAGGKIKKPPREVYPGDIPTGRRRKFRVSFYKIVEISLDTSVLAQGVLQDNPIRAGADESFVVEHIAFNLVVNDLQLSQIDGYANCPNGSASVEPGRVGRRAGRGASMTEKKPISLDEIKAILSPEEVKERLAEIHAREEDRRTLTGKFAPPEYVCRVCEGCVASVREFSDSGRIGGPAPRAFISHWRCEGCGLMYEGLTKLQVPLKIWGT